MWENKIPAACKSTLSNKTIKALAWFLLIGAMVAFYGPNASTGWKKNTVPAIDGWNFFHYYLGAKYFNEVGYFDFYQCAILAGKELGIGWNENTIIRDLRTYQLSPSKELPLCPRNRFSDERWREYTQDVAWIQKSDNRMGTAWSVTYAITDKGYNPLPSWSVLAGAVANTVPPEGSPFAVVMNIDLLFFILSVILIWWSAGLWIAWLTAFFSIFFFGSYLWISGQFLQYLWILGIVVSVALWRKEKPAASGVFIGLAAGTRAFPIFFAAPMLIVAGYNALRGVKNKKIIRFCIGFLGALAIFFLIGSLSSRGVSAWREWGEKITVHASYIRGEIFNIGLSTLISSIASSERRGASTYLEDYSHTQNRLQSFERVRLLFYSFVGISLILWFWLLYKTKQTDLFGYGFIPMFFVVSLSPFYYYVFVLLPFLFWEAPQAIRLYALLGGSFLIVTFIYFLRYGYFTFSYYEHVVYDLMMFIFILGLFLAWYKYEKISELKL